jgi:hypothetical protein
MARAQQNMTKPMRRLTDEDLRVSRKRVRWERYSGAALLIAVGVLMLWAGFTS